jgi:hypothetical protein
VNDDTLRHVPDYALWGYVGYKDSADDSLAQTFVDTLVSIGSTPLNVKPGNYFYFEYGQDSVFIQPIDNTYTFTKEFFFKYNESFNTINEVVNTYYYDPAYKRLHIIINWFNPGGGKSAIISPGNCEEKLPLPGRLK